MSVSGDLLHVPDGTGASTKMRHRRAHTVGGLPCSTSDVSRVTSGVTSSYKRSVISATSGYHSGVTSAGSLPGLGYNRSRLWTATSRATINDIMTSTNSVISGNGDVTTHCADRDPFVYVSADRPALHVWRAEAGQLVTVDANDHGFFHEGACYLVLKVRSDHSTSLHCWRGQSASQFQGHESVSFLRNFPEGVIYLEGKPRTTIARACKYVKRLYVIKGRKFVTATCKEPLRDELDSEGAALLDGFPRMYLWVGARCDRVRRVKAIQLARRMRNWQRKGRAHIIVVDEADSQQNEAFLKKLKTADSKEGETKMVNGSSHSSSDPEEKLIFHLHRVSGDRVLYDMPFAARAPLLQRFLITTDSYLLDQGPNCPVFVWVGAKADNADFSEAVCRGQSFAAHKGYPIWLPVCRITEGSEPPSFKVAFWEWKERAVPRALLSRSYSVGNIGRALFSRSDPRTVAKTSALTDSDITLGSDGVTETFRVDGESLEPPWDQPGVFLNSDCYVIWHRPDPQFTSPILPANVLFYWLGSGSEETTQTNCLRLCLTMACALDQAVVIRVLDDKEPQSLLSVFDNSMVVYDQDVLSTGSDVSLYCVRECAQGSMRVQQVPPKASYLNSSASFILLTPSRCILWFGKLTGGSEREFSKTMLAFLDSRRTYSYDLVTEGREPDAFWEALGPRVTYEEHFEQPALSRRSPRMSRCCRDHDGVTFHEVPDFSQEDLSESDIYIMDVFDQLFMWCGRSVEEESRKQLLPLYLKEYMARDPAGRKESDVHVWIISHGSEPDAFRRYFAFWDQHGYGGEEAYGVARRRLRQENARIDVDVQLVDQTYTRVTRHPYRVLLKADLPADVMQDHREHHLSDRQFTEATKKTRYDFYRLPEWKQAQVLRSARLAHFPPSSSSSSSSTSSSRPHPTTLATTATATAATRKLGVKQ